MIFRSKSFIKKISRPFFTKLGDYFNYVIAPANYSNCSERVFIHSADTFQRLIPVCLGFLHKKFIEGAPGITSKSEETFVRELSYAKVFSAQGFVINNKNEICNDAISVKFHSTLLIKNIFFRKPFYVMGNCLLISGNHAAENYFHWMTDAIPKIAIAIKGGFNIETFDKILVSDNKLGFQQQTLNYLGISPTKVASLIDHDYIICKNIVAPSDTCLSGNVSPWIIQYLRESFRRLMVADDCQPKKVYVSRKYVKKRLLLNEQEVQSTLEKAGFVIVYPELLSFKEQVNLFYNADEVIGVHGAAFTNIIFSKPGTLILEFFPVTYVNQCYWVIAGQNKLKYAYVLGEGEDTTTTINHLADANFYVSIEKVLEVRAKALNDL